MSITQLHVVDTLLNDSQPCKLIYWLGPIGAHRSEYMKFIIFSVYFNTYFACSIFSQLVQMQMLGEVEN